MELKMRMYSLPMAGIVICLCVQMRGSSTWIMTDTLVTLFNAFNIIWKSYSRFTIMLSTWYRKILTWDVTDGTWPSVDAGARWPATYKNCRIHNHKSRSHKLLNPSLLPIIISSHLLLGACLRVMGCWILVGFSLHKQHNKGGHSKGLLPQA